MTEFKFDISEEDIDVAYGLVRQKFAVAHNRRWIRQENPSLNAFDLKIRACNSFGGTVKEELIIQRLL